jgi:uncharacterized alkaline shock family protein YloU
MLSNAKGKPIVDDIGFFDFLWHEEGVLELRVFVILQFGSSIGAVTNELINGLRSRIEAVTGVRVVRVHIAVKGVFSKYISRRNLEISG